MLAEQLRECADLHSALDCALRECMALSDAGLGTLQLMDWEAGYLQIRAQHGFDDDFLTFFKRVEPNGGSACARALRRRDSIIIGDIMSDKEFALCRDVACHAGFRAVQSTPLVSSNGAVVGIASTHFTIPHRPSDATVLGLKDLARVIADAVIFHRARVYRGGDDGADVDAVVIRTAKALEKSHQRLQRAHATVMRARALLGVSFPADTDRLRERRNRG